MENKTPVKRADYRELHHKIEETVFQFFVENKRLPSDQEIAEIIGVSRRTVNRHRKSINLTAYLPRLSMLTPKLLQRYAAKMLMEPTAKDIQIWMKLVEGKEM